MKGVCPKAGIEKEGGSDQGGIEGFSCAPEETQSDNRLCQDGGNKIALL